MKATIIAHGVLNNFEILKRECDNSDIIICADGGAEFAFKNNITPNYLIGDFDSIDKAILDYYETKDTEIITYPREKDYTDTEICIDKAFHLNCEEICIIAGIGGRIDHSLGNIGLLHKISKLGMNGYIAGEDCYIYLCSKELEIKGEIGELVSIIPFKDDAQGVCLEGFKYPLMNATIRFGQPIGLSNVMLKPIGKVKIGSGEVLVIKNIIS
jgi:thiamine pyrophosphokinase